MCRSARSRSRSAWAAARATSSTGSPACDPARSCSRWKAWMSRPLARHFGLRAPSCRFPRPSRNGRCAEMKLNQLKQYKEKLRSNTAEALSDELLKLRREQFSLRMQRATGQSPKPDQFKDARRNIARLKTVQREKRAAAGSKS